MQVMFTIPGPLREFTASRSAVRVSGSGANRLQVLQALFVVYPDCVTEF